MMSTFVADKKNAPVADRSTFETTKTNGSEYSAGLAAPLLARLDKVRPAGPGRWYACCPAHDDKTPSLSIREADGKVLFHCFSGCYSDDILAAAGIKWSDLYPDRWECAQNRPSRAVEQYARRTLAAVDPLDHERLILKIAAADLRAGKVPSLEDRARLELARERLAGGAS